MYCVLCFALSFFVCWSLCCVFGYALRVMLCAVCGAVCCVVGCGLSCMPVHCVFVCFRM